LKPGKRGKGERALFNVTFVVLQEIVFTQRRGTRTVACTKEDRGRRRCKNINICGALEKGKELL